MNSIIVFKIWKGDYQIFSIINASNNPGNKVLMPREVLEEFKGESMNKKRILFDIKSKSGLMKI